MLCSLPAVSILLQKPHILDKPYQDLPPNVFPLMPAESTMAFDGNIKIKTKQIPLAPAFALTEYKVQGATFKKAVLDLRRPTARQSRKKENWNHRQFCSVYVQLSRLQTLDGVQLLQPIEYADINNHPHPALLRATAQLDRLSKNTLESLMADFNDRRRCQI